MCLNLFSCKFSTYFLFYQYSQNFNEKAILQAMRFFFFVTYSLHGKQIEFYSKDRFILGFQRSLLEVLNSVLWLNLNILVFLSLSFQTGQFPRSWKAITNSALNFYTIAKCFLCHLCLKMKLMKKLANEWVITQLTYDSWSYMLQHLTSGLSPSQLEREEIMDIKNQEADVRRRNREKFTSLIEEHYYLLCL